MAAAAISAALLKYIAQKALFGCEILAENFTFWPNGLIASL
jgi:hypothetical protein